MSPPKTTTKGGNLSVCMPVDCHPKILIGQDECIIKENLFSAKQWTGPKAKISFIQKMMGMLG